ncbi:hypothetical protein PG984_014116 [Apiospora sp. TS-2023a]
MLQHDTHLKDSVSVDQYKLQPIHWAAAGGHMTIIEQLLRAGVSPKARAAAQGWTPMHVAASFGRFRCLNWLIKTELGDLTRRIDESDFLKDTNNRFHESPLHIAMSQVWAAEEDEELDALVLIANCLKLSSLVTMQNYFGETPIHRLAACGLSASARKKGIGKVFGYDNDTPLTAKHVDWMRRTVLWHATLNGQAEEVRQLLKGCFNAVNIRDVKGMFPLHVACRFGYTEVVRALLEAGAWPNCVTTDLGFTPAHYAALFNHMDCLEVLIQCGANIQQTAYSHEFRCKPIHFAVVNNHHHIIERLAVENEETDMSCTHIVLDRSLNTYTGATDHQARDFFLPYGKRPLFEVASTSSHRGRSFLSQLLGDINAASSKDKDDPYKIPLSASGLTPTAPKCAVKKAYTRVDRESVTPPELADWLSNKYLTTCEREAKNQYSIFSGIVPLQATLHTSGEGEKAAHNEPVDETHPLPQMSRSCRQICRRYICSMLLHTKTISEDEQTLENTAPPDLIRIFELEDTTRTRTQSKIRDRMELDKGLMRYYKLGTEVFEWNMSTDDNRSAEQCKMRMEGVDAPEDATPVLGEETMSNDGDRASDILKGNLVAIEENREHLTPKGGLVSKDVIGRINLSAQQELDGVYDDDDVTEKDGEEDLMRMWLLSASLQNEQEDGTATAVQTDHGG